MKRRMLLAMTVALSGTAFMTTAHAQETVRVANISELSGAGSATGVNWRDGVKLAVEEINAKGGVLGKKLDLAIYDTQSDAQTSRALVQKAIDEGAIGILGTVYSASTIVNMLVAQQAGIPQFTGSESPKITQMGNEFIFRTSFGSQKSIPRIAAYMKDEMKVKKVAIAWVNNEFGKGGHTAFLAQMKEKGIEIVADVPSEVGQADFAADVVKLKGAGADAIFVFCHEEESARLVREIRKQNVNLPLIGDSTLIGQKTIDLAGEAANGVIGHVSLTPIAPDLAVQWAKRFEEKYKYNADSNAMKGYMAAYAFKYGAEKAGALDPGKIAAALHGLALKAKDAPGMLMDIQWDNTGEVIRESYMVEAKGGKQVLKATLPSN